MKSMSQSRISVNKGSVQGSIIALTIITAVVHLLLAFSGGSMPTSGILLLFLLDSIGYLTLLVTLYIPPFAAIQPLVRWVFIAYTALTFIVWIILTHAVFDPLDYTDKFVELSLIGLLLAEAFSF